MRVGDVLRDQAGVISRRQALDCGLQPHDVARLLRRREWARIHDGVYVDHTGPPTWLQRAWAGVLFSAPAALCHHSALRAHEGPGRREDRESVIHVAVTLERHLVEPAGVQLHRLPRLEERVAWNLSPPRLRLDEAVLDVAMSAATDLDAVGELAGVCASRRTTAGRLLTCLSARPRVPRRRWLHDVLTDIAAGTCSVLEHGYLERVERAHRLPRAERQVAAVSRTHVVYRDAEYAQALLVELDGRLGHDSLTQRTADADRDLVAAVDGRLTVRVVWGQVFGTPCTTAASIAALLWQRGWRGHPVPCGPTCAVTSVGRQRPQAWDEAFRTAGNVGSVRGDVRLHLGGSSS